jgi:hypothetical protein
VSTDALLLPLMIDAKENRDVATADVAGAYLHAEMDGASAGIMCDVFKGYRQFVCYENGKKVMNVRLLKALYGCVKSVLLWYNKLTLQICF